MLEKVKRRLGLTDPSKDALLEDLLEGAVGFVAAYTGCHRLPEALHGVVTELAVISYNRLGMEGETSHVEGGLHVEVEGLPKHIALALAPWRQARVGE